MENEIIKFSITDLAIKELATKYQNMKIVDVKSYKLVMAGIAEIRTIRVSVEKRRKTLKKDVLEYGRRVDAAAKEIAEKLLPIETDLKATKQAEDDIREKAKIEKERLEKERTDRIQARIDAFPPDIFKLPMLLRASAHEIREMQDTLSSTEITPEEYQEFTPDALKAKKDKAQLLQQYYIARIQTDAEDAKQKAEAAKQEQLRKKHEAKQKAEDKRLAKIKADQKAESQRLVAEQKKIDDQRAAVQAEQGKLAKIEKAERLRKENLEQAEQDQIQTKFEEKMQQERDYFTKIETETEEKKHKETMRPDLEKLRMYVKAIEMAIRATEKPEPETQDGHTLLIYIADTLEYTIREILNEIDT